LAGTGERLVAATLIGAASRIGALTIAAAIQAFSQDVRGLVAYGAALAVAEVVGRTLERGVEKALSQAAKPRAAEARLRLAAKAYGRILAASLILYLVSLTLYMVDHSLALAATASTIAVAASVRAGLGYLLLTVGLAGASLRVAVATPAVALLLAMLAPAWPVAAAASGYMASALLAWAHVWAAGLTRASAGRLYIAPPEPAALASAARLVVALLLALAGSPAAVYAALLSDAGVRLGHLALPRVGRPALALSSIGLLACVAGFDAYCLAYSILVAVAGLAGVGFQPPTRSVLVA